jgi:hypothetical protein
MSVHTSGRSNGRQVHDVRWRSPVDGANMSRRFDDANDATAFDQAMRARLAYDRAVAAWNGVPERWRGEVARELEG